MSTFASKRASRQTKTSYIPTDAEKSGDKVPVSSRGNSMAKESVAPGLYSDLPVSLEIRTDELKGRGVWSRYAFKKGTILLALRPHVSVLSTTNLPLYCSRCGSPGTKTLQRCTKCRTLWYCSTACQNDDWKVHKYECSGVCNWMSSAPDGSPPGEAIRSLGRILWGRKVEGEASSWWKEIQSLQSHRSSLPPSAIESHTQLAHGLVRYLGATSPAELEQYGLHSSGDLVDLISRFTTNTFTLTSPSLSPLGTCVSPIAALFNHTCLPNAVIVFPRSSGSTTLIKKPILHVVAIKDIAPGEEILTAYIDTSLPKSQRQQTLKETYNFTCICPLCAGVVAPDIDRREALWCPKSCGGMCPAPNEQGANPDVRCIRCGATYTAPLLDDVKDKMRIGQEALDKATSIQISEPSKALNLTSHMLALLSVHVPGSSHPVLALLRLHQSLLITSLSSGQPSVLNDAIRASARAVSGLLAVFSEGHPVRGVALAELGKLLAVDEPEQPAPVSAETSSENFPPTGRARLALAVETLQRALRELSMGFGEDTQGGNVGREVREDIVRLERELDVWDRGMKNARENIPRSQLGQ